MPQHWEVDVKALKVQGQHAVALKSGCQGIEHYFKFLLIFSYSELLNFALSFLLFPLSLKRTWLIWIVTIELALSLANDLAFFYGLFLWGSFWVLDAWVLLVELWWLVILGVRKFLQSFLNKMLLHWWSMEYTFDVYSAQKDFISNLTKTFHLRGGLVPFPLSFLPTLSSTTTPTRFNLFTKLTLIGFVKRLWSDLVGECKLLV